MMLFRKFVHLVLVSAAFFAWSFSASSEETLRLGHNRTWSNAALLLGLANGDYKAAGVTVVEHEFTNPADIATALISGDLDAGTIPDSTLFSAVLKGAKLKAVALVQGRNNPPITYTVRTDSGINTIQDLRGKTAGVSVYGNDLELYLRYWMQKNGLNPKTDIQMVLIPVPSLLPSLINKQIDVAPLAAFQGAIAAQNYPGVTKKLFDYDDVLKDAIGSTKKNGMLLVMSEGFILHQRDTAVAFLTGYLRAARAMNQDPKKALAEWADFVGNKALANLPAPPTTPNDGKVYLTSLQFDADQTLRFGYLEKAIDAASTVDDSLIEAAAAKVQ
jgi:ABC-type nitrate/sulfonate/bicarbonate transport system substrate-binding protein